jgi:hypothetical protein
MRRGGAVDFDDEEGREANSRGQRLGVVIELEARGASSRRNAGK